MTIWNDKYSPRAAGDIAGQNKAVQEILSWLDSFTPGKALLLSGPAGTGKSALVEALALERNLTLLRLNASDRRNTSGIEAFARTTQTHPLFDKGKLILIDELDGISGRSDRGGIPAITKLVKSSRFPVFLLAQDPWNPKLRPLHSVSRMVKFSKTPVPSIAKRLREICESEGITPEDGVLRNLASWSQGDLRSAIQDLQTAAQGRKTLSQRDTEILGYRERSRTAHDVLPTIFKSGNIQASRKAIFECGLDPDDLFWWVESNMPLVYSGESLASALDLLSKADLLRARVRRQQNWRFKALMVDLMASLSLVIQDRKHGYIPWKPPGRLILMGRTKFARAARNALCKKIGALTHTSRKAAMREYLPYLRLILNPGDRVSGLELEENEMQFLS